MYYPKDIYVLIACEESQVEMKAFRDLGFQAFSCDVQKPARGADWRYQIKADVTPLLEGETKFMTLDGHSWRVPGWDLIIAHPPCTYLCKVGSVHMVKDGEIDQQRFAQMLQARKFFMRCYEAKAPYVAVENPLPMARANLPKPSCFIQPHWFGIPYSKKTLYWLKNLPPLMAEISAGDFKEYVRSSRGKYRSRSFEGVAKAMAKQWGRFILDEMNKDDSGYALQFEWLKHVKNCSGDKDHP